MSQEDLEEKKPPPVSPRGQPGTSPRARLALLSSLAFIFPVSIAAGGFAGHYMDQKLATFPWLTLLGLLFGVAAGFINLLKAVKAFDKND